MADYSDFLSFLVNETLELQKIGETQLSSFELKLNDYGLSFFRGVFVPQNHVIHFDTPMGTLDFPVNWSVFAGEVNDGGYAILDEKHDPDKLFSVMRKAWNPSVKKVLITHADGFCYFVCFKAGEDSCLHDLLNPQEWLKAG